MINHNTNHTREKKSITTPTIREKKNDQREKK